MEEITSLFQAFVARRTRAEVEALCLEHGLAYGPVQSIADLVDDPQLRHRGMLTEIEHPDGQGKIPVRGVPIRFSESPGSLRTPPPTVGEHTDDVLRELCGCDANELAELRADGII